MAQMCCENLPTALQASKETRLFEAMLGDDCSLARAKSATACNSAARLS